MIVIDLRRWVEIRQMLYLSLAWNDHSFQPLQTTWTWTMFIRFVMVGSTQDCQPPLGNAQDGLMSLVSLVAKVLEQPMPPTIGGLGRKDNVQNLRPPIRKVGSTANG